jgi:BetI-type transcriptional repressor, C-terminal/Bacterial regulatory proteins, tetR family
MSPRRKLSAERRRQILDAAVAVVAERGLCDTRIEDVAKRAGTSAGLVISEQQFYAEAKRDLASIQSARDQLAHLLRQSCATGSYGDLEWRDGWLLWLDLWARAPRDPDVARDRQQLDRRWRETLAEVVRHGQELGEFGPVDPDDFAVRLAALIDGLAIQVVLADPDVPAGRMLDLCMVSAASELGFSWTDEERAHPSAARLG